MQQSPVTVATVGQSGVTRPTPLHEDLWPRRKRAVYCSPAGIYEGA